MGQTGKIIYIRIARKGARMRLHSIDLKTRIQSMAPWQECLILSERGKTLGFQTCLMPKYEETDGLRRPKGGCTERKLS
ncbi:hypothetical protein BXT84_11205 [Sulfobacillus thermotolerans]|uniref:Uncharacterized protein n=1 Tax=Sulfobacillus thermotolerans TaxID=338644 RepID=A0ABM6RSW3_9FIRM|nr:hypothetical protein BXT84_11205 [Sulfobacillus thermotolerans]